MRRKRVPLPAHFTEFEKLLKRASAEAIERAVARMRECVPGEFQRCTLDIRELRFIKLRKEDLKRAGVPAGIASRFAEAEARYRLQIARVAGSATLVDWVVTLVELLPNGELTIIVDVPGSKDSHTELAWSFPGASAETIIGNRVVNGEPERPPPDAH